MSNIRSQNTGVEILVFRELRKRKIYFQKHYKKAIGNPDIALPRKKKAVFIDGDFWHGYQFSKLKERLPKTYWIEKIAKNRKRDRVNSKKLKEEGWEVLRIWEHEILGNYGKAINKVAVFLEGEDETLKK